MQSTITLTVVLNYNEKNNKITKCNIISTDGTKIATFSKSKKSLSKDKSNVEYLLKYWTRKCLELIEDIFIFFSLLTSHLIEIPKINFITLANNIIIPEERIKYNTWLYDYIQRYTDDISTLNVNIYEKKISNYETQFQCSILLRDGIVLCENYDDTKFIINKYTNQNQNNNEINFMKETVEFFLYEHIKSHTNIVVALGCKDPLENIKLIFHSKHGEII